MRFFLLLFWILVLTGPSIGAVCESKNHIILIHGIGGGKATFGSMEEYLNRYDTCFRTESFVYETGNSSLSTYDFANHLHQFVMKKINSGEISRKDKISLIMHSQGGIVGSLWVNYLKQMYPDLYWQLDSFITLSTPYWGADMANFGRFIFYSLPPGLGNPISPFGRIELNEMSYGSRTIREMDWIYREKFSFRPLAIAGLHRNEKYLNGESDVVVPAYSSRPEHYQLIKNINSRENSGVIGSDLFDKTDAIPFVTVPATHIQLDLPGVADIPKSCLTSPECRHPSIDFITDHLMGREVASHHPKLKFFRISLYLNNGSTLVEDKSVTLKILKKDFVSIKPSMSHRAPASYQEGKSFTIEGSVEKGEKQTVQILVKLTDTLERVIDIPVEGGHSTLIKLNFHDY